MASQWTRKELIEQARGVGLYVTTWSPGDGVTRYRFAHEDGDYFAVRALYTALGLTEAVTFWRGYRAGLEAKPKVSGAALAWLEDAIGDAEQDALGAELLGALQ